MTDPPFENTPENAPASDDQARLADMAPLFPHVRRFMDAHQATLRRFDIPGNPAALLSRFSFAERKKGRPEVILAEDVFVELGHPSTASVSTVLVTCDPALVEHGRVSVAGPDLPQMADSERRPIAQIVMVAADPDRVPDPFMLDNTQYLMHRLPGYMVRSVPGRLWARVSRQGRDKGLDLSVIGTALCQAFVNDFEGITAAEVLFVTESVAAVSELDMTASEARVFSGQHKKLVLGIDGSVECSELNCETCEEKPVCDNLRDIVAERAKGRGGSA